MARAHDVSWERWEDRIEKLDAGSFAVTTWEADILDSLVEQRPESLSPRQCEVIDNMCQKYGVA